MRYRNTSTIGESHYARCRFFPEWGSVKVVRNDTGFSRYISGVESPIIRRLDDGKEVVSEWSKCPAEYWVYPGDYVVFTPEGKLGVSNSMIREFMFWEWA